LKSEDPPWEDQAKMGWRDMLGLGERRSAPPVTEADRQHAARWRNVKVVGESHYQDALWAAAGLENTGQRVGVECIAELIPEPDNPHDPKAIMVVVSGQCVGYLSRGVARLYSKRIREMRSSGQPTICDAFIGGLVEGDENPNLGITLKFPVHEDGDYRIELGAAEVARRVLSEYREH
jgi:hypothetical protein